MKWQYLRLLGALFCLAMVAISEYTNRGSATWGLIGCASFIMATMLNLEDST